MWHGDIGLLYEIYVWKSGENRDYLIVFKGVNYVWRGRGMG